MCYSMPKIENNLAECVSIANEAILYNLEKSINSCTAHLQKNLPLMIRELSRGCDIAINSYQAHIREITNQLMN